MLRVYSSFADWVIMGPNSEASKTPDGAKPLLKHGSVCTKEGFLSGIQSYIRSIQDTGAA
jgi:hypothetical protein